MQILKNLLGDKLADITELAEIRKLLSLDKLTNISRNTRWLCGNRVMTKINASGLLVIIEKQHPLTISQFHLHQNKHNGPEKLKPCPTKLLRHLKLGSDGSRD